MQKGVTLQEVIFTAVPTEKQKWQNQQEYAVNHVQRQLYTQATPKFR